MNAALHLDHLETFRSHFREVTDVIEEAAHYGTSPKLEEKYARLRGWLMVHYKAVRPYLRHLLPSEPESLAVSAWFGREGDSFERLMACTTLETASRLPEKVLTSRIEGVRRALDSAMTGPLAV